MSRASYSCYLFSSISYSCGRPITEGRITVAGLTGPLVASLDKEPGVDFDTGVGSFSTAGGSCSSVTLGSLLLPVFALLLSDECSVRPLLEWFDFCEPTVLT